MSITRARNGLSVVPEMINGGSVTVRGVLSASVVHVTVNLDRKADMCRDCEYEYTNIVSANR